MSGLDEKGLRAAFIAFGDAGAACRPHALGNAIRAYLTAVGPKAGTVEVKPNTPVEHWPEAHEVADIVAEGKGFWKSCCGCHELNEGHPTGPWSTFLGCNIGVGCHECGGIGAVWDTTDYADMGEHLSTPSVAEAAEPDWWVGRPEGAPSKATRMRRVAEIWREQGLEVIPLYTCPSGAVKAGPPVERFGMTDEASGHEPLYFGPTTGLPPHAIVGEQYVRLSDYLRTHPAPSSVVPDGLEALVERFDLVDGSDFSERSHMARDSGGEYVRYTDYAALKAERDEARREQDAGRQNFLTMQGTAAKMLARAETAERDLAAAEEVIRPFAELGGAIPEKWLDHESHWQGYGEITAGRLRAAARWLAGRAK